MQHSCNHCLPSVPPGGLALPAQVPFAAQVWAYAKLSHYCEPLMERFAGEAQGRIDKFSQQVLLPDLQLGPAVSVPAATPDSKDPQPAAMRCFSLLCLWVVWPLCAIPQHLPLGAALTVLLRHV